MINVSELQLSYNELYEALREYVWSYPTIEALAELEISVYCKCPDLEVIKRNLYMLDQRIRQVKFDDEDIKRAFDKFSDLLNSSDTYFSKLYNTKQ